MKTLNITGVDGAASRFVQRARATGLSLLAVGMFAVPTTTYSAPIEIDFEGVGDFNPVGDFYNGDLNGFDKGVAFSGDDVALQDQGDSGLFLSTPPGDTALFLLDLTGDSTDASLVTLDYASGFSAVSFFYAAVVNGFVNVYDDTGGTGGLLYSGTLVANNPPDTCSEGFIVCEWDEFTEIAFNGVARSIVFGGADGQVGIDNISLEPAPVPLPAAAWLLLSGLAGLGALSRRRPTAN